MSEPAPRYFLHVELDPATFNIAISGATVNENMTLLLATVLYERVMGLWRATNGPDKTHVAVPDFTWRPRGKAE